MPPKQRTASYPRITTPLVRSGGRLQPASWDDAIAAAAGGFRRVLAEPGADPTERVGIFSCSKATNEVNFLIQKFGRTVLGTNNIDSCNRT